MNVPIKQMASPLDARDSQENISADGKSNPGSSKNLQKLDSEPLPSTSKEYQEPTGNTDTILSTSKPLKILPDGENLQKFKRENGGPLLSTSKKYQEPNGNTETILSTSKPLKTLPDGENLQKFKRENGERLLSTSEEYQEPIGNTDKILSASKPLKIQPGGENLQKPLTSTSKEYQVPAENIGQTPNTSKEPLKIIAVNENLQKFNKDDGELVPSTFKDYQVGTRDSDPTSSTSELVEFFPGGDQSLSYNDEEYQNFIPGIGDTFPYYRDEVEFRLIYAIPNSLLLEETNCVGEIVQLDEEFQMEEDQEFTRYFSLKCYPNGDCIENEGYISLIFEENTDEMFIQLRTINITLTLLDADKNCRFPQSLTLDHNDILHPAKQVIFGLSRYMKRDALLASEILSADKLLLQCEVQFYIIDNLLHEPYPPFTLQDCFDERGHHINIILEVNHPLWTLLSEKSPYFHKLIVKDGNTEIPMFDEKEYRSFDVMVKCIMNGTHPSGQDLSIQKLFNLYEYADYVLLTEFKEKSSDIIKERMTSRIASNVIAMADMHSDDDLKKFAIQYAVEHWRGVIASKSWGILKKERPDLAKETRERKSDKDEPPKKKRKKVTETEYVQQFQYYQ